MIDQLYRHWRLTRRAFLAGAVGVALMPALPNARTAVDSGRRTLLATPATFALSPDGHPISGAWGYDGRVPGPVLRYRQGERLRILLRNDLPQPTTIHWHGIRLPNAMDGVPHLTQAPVRPGDTFEYQFDLPDAGTYWYHSHLNGPEQVARGLAGALIVEEPEPYPVDQELIWVLDDWRLTGDGTVREDFANFHDVSHAGRIGNTVTVNGRLPHETVVRPGERLRLRLINAANARIFSLSFADLPVFVIALDGQPVAPHEPVGGRVVLGPGMRVDMVLDCVGGRGRAVDVRDDFYAGLDFSLMRLALRGDPLRKTPSSMPPPLPRNPVAEPVLEEAIRHDVAFGGGMGGMMGGDMGGMMGGGMGGMMGGGMGGMMGGGMGGMMGGGMGGMMEDAMAWTVNGERVRTDRHDHPPLFTLDRGQTCRLVYHNDTAWHHPIHVHGHHFRVLSRNGKPEPYQPLHDTVLMSPGDIVETAFVADNPGDWMFHCHIQEHQAGGMMGLIRVRG